MSLYRDQFLHTGHRGHFYELGAPTVLLFKNEGALCGGVGPLHLVFVCHLNDDSGYGHSTHKKKELPVVGFVPVLEAAKSL